MREPKCKCGCNLLSDIVKHELKPKRACACCGREFQPTRIRRMLCRPCYTGHADTRLHVRL